MRQAVWSIAAGLAGVVLCGWGSAQAAAPSPSVKPFAGARASYEWADAQPAAASIAPAGQGTPLLLAQTPVAVTSVLAVQPAAAPAVVAQGSIVRAVAPASSQPGVLWLIGMGAVLCRIGARVLRVS